MNPIRQLIGQGQLRAAIDQITELSAQASGPVQEAAFALENRFTELRRDRIRGLVLPEQARAAENQLCLDALLWISRFEQAQQVPETAAIPESIVEIPVLEAIEPVGYEPTVIENIAEITYAAVEPVQKDIMAICPNCQHPIEHDFDREIQSGYNETNCPTCKHRFFELDWLFRQPAAYKNLTKEEAWQLDHALHAIESDLRLRHYKRAYERAEDQKTKFAKTALIHEICALTFFFAHSVEEVHVHESARRIRVYLDDAQRADPVSPTHSAYAQAIALRYYGEIKKLMQKNRVFQPVLPQPMPNQAAPDTRIEVLQQRIQHRRQQLRLLRELETCYKIWPYRSFLFQALQELHGYNGTSWLQLQFASWGNRPPMVQNSEIIDGFWWDYYYLSDNTRIYLHRDEMTALDVRAGLLTQWQQKTSDTPLPLLLVGTLGTKPQSPHPELVRNGWKYLATMVSVLFFPYLAWKVINWWVSLLLAIVLAMIIMPRLDEIKVRLRRFWRAVWSKPRT